MTEPSPRTGAEPASTGARASTAARASPPARCSAAAAARASPHSRSSSVSPASGRAAAVSPAAAARTPETPGLDRQHVPRDEHRLAPSAARNAATPARAGPGQRAACPARYESAARPPGRGRAAEPARPARASVLPPRTGLALWPSPSPPAPCRRSAACPALRLGDRDRQLALVPRLAYERRPAASARWARQPTSMYGRPIWRASARACSRCRAASSIRDVHSSTMPRFIGAEPGVVAERDLARSVRLRGVEERMHLVDAGPVVAAPAG